VLNLKKPSVWDDVRRGPEAGLFQSEFLVNGKEDAANNFASGQYTVGKEIMEIVNDRLQQKIDNSENVQGFNVSWCVVISSAWHSLQRLSFLLNRVYCLIIEVKKENGFEEHVRCECLHTAPSSTRPGTGHL